MSDRRYSIKEVFWTLQGEGVLAGTPAMFIRFGGCNLWSGEDEDRDRDARRHDVICPRFCDTDFRDGDLLSAMQVVEAVKRQLGSMQPYEVPLIVFTGGEPLLQLDKVLLVLLAGTFPEAALAVETNGTVEPKEGVLEALDHVCVSPKSVPDKLVVREGTELKVVFPAYDPREYEEVGVGFRYRLVSPQADTSAVGVSLVVRTVEAKAAEFCLKNPSWRLSTQTHKSLGLR